MAGLRLAMASFPFERDEGAYAYIARGLLLGETPYVDAWDHKPPGVYFVYALAQLALGDSGRSIHLLAAIALALAMVLVFALARDFFASISAAYASAAMYGLGFLLLSNSGANTEVFLSTLVAGVILLSLKSRKATWLALPAGALLAAAFWMKQVALFDGLAAATALLLARANASGSQERSLRAPFLRVSMLALGFCAGLVPVVAFFTWRGALTAFWSEAFVYNVAYVGANADAGRGLGAVLWDAVYDARPTVLWLLPLWTAAIIGAKVRMRSPVPLLWLGSSLAGVALGWRWWSEHYYLQLLAPASLVAGHGIAAMLAGTGLRFLKAGRAVGAVLAISLLLAAATRYASYFESDFHAYLSPIVETAAHIERTSEPASRLFVWGREPQLYVLSNRRSPSPFINNYPLTRGFRVFPDAESQLVSTLRRALPEIIVIEGPPSNPAAAPPDLKALLTERYQPDSRFDYLEVFRLSRQEDQ